MAEIRYRICDKCGKKLDKGIWGLKTWTNVRVLNRCFTLFVPSWDDYNFELCEKCVKELKTYLRAPNKEKTEGEDQ